MRWDGTGQDRTRRDGTGRDGTERNGTEQDKICRNGGWGDLEGGYRPWGDRLGPHTVGIDCVVSASGAPGTCPCILSGYTGAVPREVMHLSAGRVLMRPHPLTTVSLHPLGGDDRHSASRLIDYSGRSCTLFVLLVKSGRAALSGTSSSDKGQAAVRHHHQHPT